MVESLCSSSRRRPNSLTTCVATVKTSEGTSAANSLSKARPTRSSLSSPTSFSVKPKQIGSVACGPFAEAVDRFAGNAADSSAKPAVPWWARVSCGRPPAARRLGGTPPGVCDGAVYLPPARAPTVAERSTNPPARDMGGEGELAGDGLTRAERERLGDMVWTSLL